MSSGVKPDSDCSTKYEELKIKHKYQYIIFKLSPDKKSIVVENAAEKSSAVSNYEDEYNEFTKNLPDEDCRWAVYDFEFEKEGAGKRNKLVFISWAPDDLRPMQKMVHGSSTRDFRNTLNGIAVEIQGTDRSEVAYETVLDKASRGH